MSPDHGSNPTLDVTSTATAATSFGGVIGRTYADSTPWWPPPDEPPAGSPNVVIIVLDDVGYAQLGCYGSDIATPTFDRLAAEGLRYSNFHTTALCSPTRACLLTGRNHHANGMARIVEYSAGFPGYNAIIPRANGFLSSILLDAGWATFAVGKWHLAPAAEMTPGSPRRAWPLGRGFERFYGFLGGETDQYHPQLIHDNHPVTPPHTPQQGYHLTEDLADRAIGFVRDLRSVSQTRPFMLWFAPGACHAPHQAPASTIEPYRGAFDGGWDLWREAAFARQRDSGLLPAAAQLSVRPDWVPAWDALSADERRLYARMMEVYAGFLTHTDAQVGRVIAELETLGELDNTIVVALSDNGASAEGGHGGSFNEQYFFNFVPESLEENLRRIDDLGTPAAHNHYPWGWAWAGNTPFKRFKRDTHEGGIADPLIVRWPTGLGRPDATRHQYVHAIDLMPTLLELVGVETPSVLAGVEQAPIDGASFAASLRQHDASSARITQYYEMLGSRAIYHDGWKAVVFHPAPFLAYDGSDVTHPFDDDVWELYHVAEDPSEVHDLAATQPRKLADLQQVWWEEATARSVLPLNNEPGRFADHRHRRDRYVYAAGIGPLPESMAPDLRHRPFTVSAELDVPTDVEITGPIVAHGSHAGGYIVYLADRRAHYAYNYLGTDITTVSTDVDLPQGPITVTVAAAPTSNGMSVSLLYGETTVGAGTVPLTTPVTYGMFGFTIGFQPGQPIVPALPGRAELPAGILRRVVIQTEPRARPDDPKLRERIALATQ